MIALLLHHEVASAATASWPFLANGHPSCIDFGWMWLSGKFAISGDTGRIFEFAAWSSAQAAFYGPAVEDGGVLSAGCPYFNRFYYPPTFLFFTYPLGYLSYVSALVLWLTASFALYQTAIYSIIPRGTALIVAASPVFVIQVNVLMGHNGFLSAGLIGLSLVLMERRQWLSGICLGLLTYKPHFGLLFPVALLASRNWRVIGSTALTTIIMAVVAMIFFGFGGWVQFIESLTDRTSSLGVAAGHKLDVQSVFGLLDWIGAGASFSWSAQVIVSVIVAFGIWVIWSKPISYNLKAAALSAGLLLVSPYLMPYDLLILSIAAAFLIKEGLSRGFLPGERTAIFICWFSLSFLTVLPWMPRVGPVVCAILLFLVVRRVIVYEGWPVRHLLPMNLRRAT
jgi:hypothetical protein